MGILSGAQSQMASLSADAETANADPADLASQVTLLEERVKELTQAVVLLSGPKGVTLASGEHMQLAAARSLEMNAGNNADIGVMKNLFIGVGQALSVFVRKAGIKLFANKGAISLQAQNDLMELLAKKSIEITSTEDEIIITAKKKITINGGGSYIRLDPCGIEAGTQGEYNVKAGYYGRKPGEVKTPDIKIMPKIVDRALDFDEQFQLFDSTGERVLGKVNYKIVSSSGEIWEGITDEHGFTERVFTENESGLSITYNSK